MNGLDLYSGSGIGSLAFRYILPNYQTVCYVENDPYCQAILLARIQDGLLDDAPIWDDVRTFNGRVWRGKVDFVFGGFPCQPFSVAGQRKGEADKRNLWPDTARIIGEVRPRYAFLENVPGLLSSGYFETILCDLAKIGYDVEWDTVGASDVGANHRRKRLWILAYATTNGNRSEQDGTRSSRFQHNKSRRSGMGGEPCNSSQDVADTDRTRQLQQERIKQNKWERIGDSSVEDRNPNGGNGNKGQIKEVERRQDSESTGVCDNVADTTKQGLEGKKSESEFPGEQSRLSAECSWWQVEPDVDRVVDGLAFRVDRLRMLGNGWVCQVVARILKIEQGIGV